MKYLPEFVPAPGILIPKQVDVVNSVFHPYLVDIQNLLLNNAIDSSPPENQRTDPLRRYNPLLNRGISNISRMIILLPEQFV